MSNDALVDLEATFATFTEHWAPRTVATINDYDVRLVKVQGEFSRHSHPETDELFLVLSGRLTIKMDGGDVDIGPGQLFVVPRGSPHQPVATEETRVLLMEPSATVNTGDSPGPLTAARRLA